MILVEKRSSLLLASEELAEVEAELVGFTVSSLPACLVL
ncbi:unnamed protein product, partial [Brassica oleracea]